jgi:4-hydroxy-3-polyprenylbenzoate decarboxylase
MENARRKWEQLGLPPLKPSSPWHGYTLGDWNERWERFARRTLASEWQENGVETLARQRPGLEPETSVRKVET